MNDFMNENDTTTYL